MKKKIKLTLLDQLIFLLAALPCIASTGDFHHAGIGCGPDSVTLNKTDSSTTTAVRLSFKNFGTQVSKKPKQMINCNMLLPLLPTAGKRAKLIGITYSASTNIINGSSIQLKSNYTFLTKKLPAKIRTLSNFGTRDFQETDWLEVFKEDDLGCGKPAQLILNPQIISDTKIGKTGSDFDLSANKNNGILIYIIWEKCS